MATVTRRLAALLGASGAGLTDSATSSQITTTSLKDDAVTSAKIGTDQVGADALSSSAIAGAADIPANSVGESELSVDYTAQSVPHIIPGLLYPSYVASGTSNKLLDGTTDHSGAFGTEQVDGRKYYYTNIAGSKPIKDPRIGGHFGSQRHMFKSIQQLEQETAIHGDDVYSIDGREWMRGVGNLDYVNDTRNIQLKLESATTSFFEITGYFSAFNFLNFSSDTTRNLKVELDGVTAHATFNPNGANNSPLGSRYVSAGSVFNVDLTASGSSLSSDTLLGIHTIRISYASGHINYPTGCELIVQDTTSTANRSKIQIPSQDVVSFGKKFTVSGTPHYDPFNGFTSGSSVSSYIDTATSLGVENWKHSSTYYRPYNGGRVVKWVDSSGVIKTSVTLMPPNAQNFGGTAITAKANASAANDTYLPTFSGAIDDSLSEVAKHYIHEEFGNGGANAGTGGAYADASMLSGTSDDIAYVMDDGLTSLSANAVTKAGATTSMPGYINIGSGDSVYTTFIGTGVTLGITNWAGDGTHIHKVAFNLPYGTHNLRVQNSSDTIKYIIDGVEVQSSYQTYWAPFEFTFHQPKKPLIPEDACVLADYMLMADFVPQTNGDLTHISKGVRFCSSSRDAFYDGNSATSTKFYQNIVYGTGGFQISLNQNGYTLSEGRIVGFGHSFGVNFMRDSDRMTGVQARLDGSNYTYASSDIWDTDTVWDDSAQNGTLTKAGSSAQEVYGIKNQTLGIHTFGDKTTANPNATKFNDWIGWQIASPIHTSSHYQTFEMPFLHELVGGDRNMEQTNLVCSPDGKTWDQITRDTSYIGNIRCTIGKTTTNQGNSNPIIWDVYRGRKASVQFEDFMTKDFAIAYDKIICLVDGDYEIHYWTYVNSNTTEGDHRIKLNGQFINQNYTVSMNTNSIDCLTRYHLKRGDYLQIQGSITSTMGGFQITKV